MALRLKSNCRVCQTISDEVAGQSLSRSRLYKLIEQYQMGGATLTYVNEQYPKFVYQSLSNHAKKHQNVSEKRLNEARIKAVQGRKMAELTVKGVDHKKFLDDVVQQVMDQIEAGDAKITVKDALQATKISTDMSEREKDRGLKVMEMIYGFTSGELKNNGKISVTNTNSVIDAQVVDDPEDSNPTED